jgi:hypothetical protein
MLVIELQVLVGETAPRIPICVHSLVEGEIIEDSRRSLLYSR